ncbi:phosphatidylinositol 4-kinase beta 1 isoform X2 [Cinnamomum micranthum f. kanehirae]|uniref:1-phosphatidylinositol 4-kinase n=1 Tax=Cinnamomum micranthum f. kanehirae TaxID=337451 RepID=A0A443PQ07_9MAGN|nr:phosphatidylinositol 4-kinase beta 1 isoform X2 [Cinnamomum micranthum f. kanehirae]
MVRLLLGLNRFSDNYDSPREITRPAIPKAVDGGGVGENGWLIRFFDSSFFCEWIAVSYLYKHDHPGVRDYLCNRMYTLPLSGIESYLFQICYMLLHKPSPSLDKFVVDICTKSLQISLKVHWFLMAELEDSEDETGNEDISRIQEKCQIAATLMGEWPPFIVPPAGSPRNRPVIDRILSSKHRLLSLASSPSPSPVPAQRSFSFTPPSSGSDLLQEGHNSSSKVASDENKLFRKLIPGVKVRDALFFRKSVEKDDEEPDKDGFFRRLLRESRDDEETDKEGFFRRLLSKDYEESDKDGFFRRLLRDSKDDVEADKEGFFRRLPRESKDVEGDFSPNSDGFFKRLFRDSRSDSEDKMGGLKSGEDDSKDGFFRRIFKEKLEEKKDGNEKVEEEEQLGDGDDDKEGFFHRLFKDKHEEKKGPCVKTGNEEKLGEEEDKDRFFHRFFKDKHEEKKDGKEKAEDEEKVREDDEKEGFFRRIFKEKHGEKKDGNEEKLGEDDEKEGFFHRLFKEKPEEKKDGNAKTDDEEKTGEVDEKDGFFRRLFKEKHEEQKDGSEKAKCEKGSRNCEEEEPSDFLSFRRLFRVHPEDVKIMAANEISNGGSSLESSPGTENFFRRMFRDRERSVEDSDLFGLKKHKEKHPGSPKQRNEKSNSKPPLPNNITYQIRKGTYHVSLDFVQSLCETSYNLLDIFPIEDRKSALRESLAEINSHLAAAHSSGGVCFPMGKEMYRVVHIPEEEAVLLNSREKAPYMICVEVLKGEVQSHIKETFDAQKLSRGGIPLANRDAQLPKPPPWAYPLWNLRDVHHSSDGMSISTSQAIDKAMAHLWEAKVKFVHVSLSVEQQLLDSSENGEDHNLEWVSVILTAVPGVNMEDVEVHEPARRKDHRRVPSTIAIEEAKAAAAKGEAPPGLPLKGAGQDSSDAQPKVNNGGLRKATDALSGELWEVKKERIQKASVYGRSPGWDLRSVIVKSGDDCRQEHLAVQLISHFYDIFQEAGLPLWLRPYEVLVTSSYTALIETIPDTASIHAIKSRFPNITSLRDFFIAKYEENSPNFKLAQRNFVESMAGYSILCYLLQVKDRHNGNLLMDEEGHIIHIDFGFMLSNSPGGVNFESAPFKLTRELLEVMDSDAEGIPSEFFDYFKVLCIQGFLTCRKHAERIILLVEMLQDSGFPCFKGGPRTFQNLRKRFHLSLTEEQCVSLVLSLISSSLDAWRTRQYDYYQRILNGIL